jgi:conjugal transfer pilus assembly protein TraD
MTDRSQTQQNGMALGMLGTAVLAAALTPLGLLAASVVTVFAWANVQLLRLRWWSPLLPPVVVAIPLAMYWTRFVDALAVSREGQLHPLLHPDAPASQWGSRWVEWTVAALPFSIVVGGMAAALLCGTRERTHPQRAERRPRAGQVRLWRVGRRARSQSERSLERRGVILGVDDDGRRVHLRDDELAGHTLVVGATGSGKTTTLMVMLAAAIRRGHPVCFVDLKGDRALLGQLGAVAGRADRSFAAWSIDGDATWNPLAVGNPTELKDKLIGLEEWTEPHYRRAAERYLQTIFSVLACQKQTPTLERVVALMNPGALNRELRHVPDELADRIAAYLDGLTGDQTSAIRGLTNRLAVITESVAGPYLTSESPSIHLRTTLTGGGVVAFSLNASTYGELAAHLGALVIQDLKAAAGALLDAPGGLPAYVAVDEFSALGTDHLLALLARARSAGVRVVLCTQELADLERAAEGFRDQVLGNTATKLAHRQDVPASADTLAGIAGTRQTWHRTRQTSSLINAGVIEETGAGTKRLVDEYLVHPNTLKTLRTGEAVLIRKHPKPDVRVIRVIPTDSDGTT